MPESNDAAPTICSIDRLFNGLPLVRVCADGRGARLHDSEASRKHSTKENAIWVAVNVGLLTLDLTELDKATQEPAFDFFFSVARKDYRLAASNRSGSPEHCVVHLAASETFTTGC